MFSDNVKNLMQFIPEGYEDLKKGWRRDGF